MAEQLAACQSQLTELGERQEEARLQQSTAAAQWIETLQLHTDSVADLRAELSLAQSNLAALIETLDRRSADAQTMLANHEGRIGDFEGRLDALRSDAAVDIARLDARTGGIEEMRFRLSCLCSDLDRLDDVLNTSQEVYELRFRALARRV